MKKILDRTVAKYALSYLKKKNEKVLKLINRKIFKNSLI